MIQNIVLIGAGKLATQLGLALARNGFNIRQVYSRTPENAEELAERLNAYCTSELLEIQTNADLYIIAVKDAVLHQVVEEMPKVNGTVVHTAGAISMDLLIRFNKYGVFYPFQTFTKEREVDFKNIPILLDGNDEDVKYDLKQLAKKISETVMFSNSAQRQQVHLAAVFACNFTNHMYAIAEKLLQKHSVSFDVVKPLILETAQKVVEISPVKAQTGPAVRGDKNVMDKHLSLLNQDDELSVLYSKLSRRIVEFNANGRGEGKE